MTESSLSQAEAATSKTTASKTAAPPLPLPDAAVIETMVTSTRVRLARNLFGYNFPARLTKEEAREVVRLVACELNRFNEFTEYDIGRMDFEEAKLLQEKHLISADLIRRREISAAFISADRDVSVMVNEEDHLREQYILKGYDLYRAYGRISGIDDCIARGVSFAYDDKLGYITACPSNLGTGMRASVMMFLPGMAKYGRIEELLSALKAKGLTVRGVFGEGSAAEGFSYQISNERTLGLSEADILELVSRVTLDVAEVEAGCRRKMLREDGIGYKDVCLRAFGALTNCARLSAAEAASGLTMVRLGAALGFFAVRKSGEFSDFIADMRPAAFRKGNCPGGDENECDLARAKVMRNILPTFVSRTD